MIKEVARYRANTYGFLAGIFREALKADQIKNMLDAGILNLLIDAGCNIDEGFFAGKPVEQVEEELAVEYTALFIGPGTHIPPYESVHVCGNANGSGYYWAECTANVKAWVEHYGLKLSERFGSIPDHISIELEFMQKVIAQEDLAWERDDRETARKCIEVEKAFFNAHIIRWVPTFCDKVVEAANLNFYGEMAILTKDFIMEEEILLNYP